MRFVIVGLALLTLSACSLSQETWVNTDRVEIHNDQFTDTFEVAQLNDSTLRAIAAVYERYGDGPMSVGLTARNAATSDQIAKTLRKYGVRDVRVEREMPERGAKEMAIISFPAITARSPEKCTMMPGADGNVGVPNSAQGERPYAYGCTVETMLARQVHKPRDLLGRDGFSTNADGSRAETVVSRRGYYDDRSYEPLKGEKATGK